MDAKLINRLMSIEDIVKMAYSDEIENEARIKSRKIRTKQGC